jgi:hypothetical protein
MPTVFSISGVVSRGPHYEISILGSTLMNLETIAFAASAALAALSAAPAGAAEKSPQEPRACQAALVGERAEDRTVQQDYLFKCAGVTPTTTRISFDRPTAEEIQHAAKAAGTRRAPAGR